MAQRARRNPCARGKCHIWYSADFPPQKFIIDHERLHCAGYDHIGSTAMQRFLQRHLASQAGNAAAAARLSFPCLWDPPAPAAIAAGLVAVGAALNDDNGTTTHHAPSHLELATS